jgi:hypothetical protein
MADDLPARPQHRDVLLGQQGERRLAGQRLDGPVVERLRGVQVAAAGTQAGSSRLLPVLVIMAAHSRFITGRMLPTRQTQDLLLGSWALQQQLERVPYRLIWDNETGRPPRMLEARIIDVS